jgi:hypothetical protein
MLYVVVVVVWLAVPTKDPRATGRAWAASGPPTPVLERGHSVDWWFVFKFNVKSFPGCGVGNQDQRQCPFGGEAQSYSFSQQYVFASSEAPKLQQGDSCVGATSKDPLGATFDTVYNDSSLYYVIWNDQFYEDPKIAGCGQSCGAPWGHSKGMLVWNENGDGLVLQVTTPSWPASGNSVSPRRTDGNTLGCVRDNNVKVSQHFFALRLKKDDVTKVLKAVRNASVVTDPTNKQIVHNGGPDEVQSAVQNLGKKWRSAAVTKDTLSSGIVVISKPSGLHVPPWQMVSAVLGGVALRTATWWAKPQIVSTTASTKIACWDDGLGKAGPVQVATTGRWGETTLGLKGGPGPNFNHAKIGVSTSGARRYAIFGDMNQQGALSGKCASSQNGRGGLFYVVENSSLADSLAELIRGDTAPTKPSNK